MAQLCGKLGLDAASIGVGYELSGEHGPDEHIRIADLVNGTKHVALLISRFAAPGV